MQMVWQIFNLFKAVKNSHLIFFLNNIKVSGHCCILELSKRCISVTCLCSIEYRLSLFAEVAMVKKPILGAGICGLARQRRGNEELKNSFRWISVSYDNHLCPSLRETSKYKLTTRHFAKAFSFPFFHLTVYSRISDGLCRCNGWFCSSRHPHGTAWSAKTVGSYPYFALLIGQGTCRERMVFVYRWPKRIPPIAFEGG